MIRLVALALAVLLPAAARAEERVRSFDSAVQVARDGHLDVTETIQVASEGLEIRRGIQRDFPTSYRDRLGQRTHVGFQVVSVTRDGTAEPFQLIGLSNGLRVRIGRAEVLLPPGDHRYVIRYRTDRQLRFDKDFDELYWNVTGNGWTFPIDAASVRITLPAPVRFGQRAVYTGPAGATGKAATVTAEGPGMISFATTAPLRRQEGLTVAAAFPKGVVTAPTGPRRTWWWLQDWAPLLAAVAATLALLGYQLRAWWVAGRGPRAGTVVPRFAPPQGLSPAATRYVARMGMDDRAFTAAIVGAGVQRQLRIERTDGGWLGRDTTTLHRTPSGQALDAPEQQMLDALFPDGTTELELKQANHATVQAGRGALEKALGKRFDGKAFVGNSDWAVLGLFAVAIAVFAVGLVAALVGTGASMEVPLVGLLAAFGLLLARRFTRGTTGCLLALAWMVVIGCGFTVLGAAIGTAVTALAAGAPSVLLPLATLPVALFAFKWMAAPTLPGRRTMDEIAGFKHYLGIAEEDRLETMTPPERTPELFERFLPYAIALDVENRWADKFASVLAAAAVGQAAGQTFGWYSGAGNAWDDPGDFASNVGSSLNDTISSAATSPSSSGGGSGGGGSSGGGGGGGGGSGW